MEAEIWLFYNHKGAGNRDVMEQVKGELDHAKKTNDDRKNEQK
jgi:hypothetical protein